ncbi:MAG: carbohydrate porin [Candidatus Methylacidiphilales bacterium]|nr:carbohydrate porin [Candidatus Methylacidiphilales bacterium]
MIHISLCRLVLPGIFFIAAVGNTLAGDALTKTGKTPTSGPVAKADAAAVTEAKPNPLGASPFAGGISGNPAASNIFTGTGEAQRFVQQQLGIKDDHGVRLGGLWAADTNWVLSGGDSQRNSFNSLVIVDLRIDLEKLTDGLLKGGSFGASFLQFNGDFTNRDAGSVQGFNSLPGPTPLDRSELYQLWVRQAFFDDKLAVRIGKVVPTYDFNNVMLPITLDDENSYIPSVSGLSMTPVFINPTLIGALPGYYNSALGATINITPVKWWYMNLGVYDGSGAKGIQTGIEAPYFGGYYMGIAETGFNWTLGECKLPGRFAVGGWHQSGHLTGPPGVEEEGASGFYLFGNQRLWYANPGKDASGVTSFVQYGINDSRTLPVNEYVGGGLTAFGLVPCRPADSFGIGAAWSRLNHHIFARESEFMIQGYYQAHVYGTVYFEPSLTYIPTPGINKELDASWSTTLRLTVLF